MDSLNPRPCPASISSADERRESGGEGNGNTSLAVGTPIGRGGGGFVMEMVGSVRRGVVSGVAGRTVVSSSDFSSRTGIGTTAEES